MRISKQEEDIKMDDNNSALNHQNGVGLKGQTQIMGGSNMNNKQDNMVGNNEINANQAVNTAQYSIPGVLHFIQHEWARFELERSQWDVDRAELQAKIAALLGERKGQENLKSDLIRRIKMLEYALKQERVKFHRLKYGYDPPMNDMKAPVDETEIMNEVAPDPEVPFSSVSNITWKQGRQLLRQYLQEIGYTETIIDVRSNRVRLILGLNNNQQEQEENINPNVNSNENNKRASETQGRSTPAKKSQPTSAMGEAILSDSEAAVMTNFDFLQQADVEISDDDDMSDDLNLVVGGVDETSMKTTKRKVKVKDEVDAEAEEVLNELNSLAVVEDSNLGENNRSQDGYGKSGGVQRHTAYGMGGGGAGDEEVDPILGLGELAQLTVNNEADSNYDVKNSKETYRKTWNAKYTLRSHFDGVRALAFHPVEPVLITASEDHTLKLWNLQKTVPAKKSASLDVEPLYTFRSHNGPVTCLAMSASGDQCYSGGLDGVINCWNLPNSNIDPYDSYDPEVIKGVYEDHTDAVWGLAVNATKGHLVSCSADGTVKLWAPPPNNSGTALLNTYTSSNKEDIPSSVDFIRHEIDRIVVAYNTAHYCIIYDTETGKQIVKLEATQEIAGQNSANKLINKVVSHPTLPITVTAHEDRHIRFWDNTTGTLIHSMVAHLDAVTSLAIDSHGLYLLSGSHDCSIRLWNLDNKTCVQEITAHRKKFDESILDVAFHPSKPYIASAGADAIAKVFV